MGLFVGVALATTVVLLSASELLVRAKIEPQDDFVSHVRLFNTSQATDAAFGDSHVARGFVPATGMINLAYPSEGIEHIDWKVRTYFANRSPGQIILQADPHLLAPYRLRNRLGDYPDRFTGSLGAENGALRVREPRHRANLVNYWSSFATGGGEIRSRINILENGAILSPGDLSKESDRWRTFQLRKRIASHRIHSTPVVAQRLEVYSNLLDFLVERGASVCMVNFPLSQEYRSAMNADLKLASKRERDAVLSFFETEALRTNARYVDLRDLSSDSSEFRDVDHLNGRAATKYGPTIMQFCFEQGSTASTATQ